MEENRLVELWFGLDWMADVRPTVVDMLAPHMAPKILKTKTPFLLLCYANSLCQRISVKLLRFACYSRPLAKGRLDGRCCRCSFMYIKVMHLLEKKRESQRLTCFYWFDSIQYASWG